MNKYLWLIGGIVGVLLVGGIFLSKTINNKGTDKTTKDLFKKEIIFDTDVCNKFPKDFVAQATGKTIIKTEKLGSGPTDVCQYYIDKIDFISLRLNKLSIENQKKGQQSFGRVLTTNEKIKMEHFIAVQEDGLINAIYLIINPNLFLVVDRSSKVMSEDEIINFATRVVDRM